MGFHFMDLIIIAAIGLALFGPKALQSVARSAGRGAAQAKAMKDKIMSELPLEDITKVTDQIPRVPLSSHQAIDMLMTPKPVEERAKDALSARNETKVDQRANDEARENHG
jgi:Sec-independent protein translocase protein TatA